MKLSSSCQRLVIRPQELSALSGMFIWLCCQKYQNHILRFEAISNVSYELSLQPPLSPWEEYSRDCSVGHLASGTIHILRLFDTWPLMHKHHPTCIKNRKATRSIKNFHLNAAAQSTLGLECLNVFPVLVLYILSTCVYLWSVFTEGNSHQLCWHGNKVLNWESFILSQIRADMGTAAVRALKAMNLWSKRWGRGLP